MFIKAKLLLVIVVVSVVIFCGCRAITRNSAANGGPEDNNGLFSRAYFYFTVAQLTFKQGDINEAVWLMERAIEHDESSLILQLELARLLLLKKETDRSLKVVLNILKRHPQNRQALVMAADIHLNNNDIQPAKQLFEKLMLFDDTDQETYLQLGRIYWDENDLNNAARVFTRMVERFPESYAAYYFQGRVFAAQGKQDEAETAFVRSLALEPSLEEPRIELLKLYQSRNLTNKITQAYEGILSINPGNHKVVMEYALHLKQIRRLDAALALLAGLGGDSLRDKTVIPTVFESYLETKQYEAAAWVIEAMLKAVPESSDLNYLAGLAYDGLSQNEQALAHMLKVLPQSRFYYNAAIHSAWLYHEDGKTDEAISIIKAAIGHESGKAELYFYLGSFYETLERYQEAIDALAAGIALDKTNGKLLFRLGVIYDKMDRKEDTIEAMKAVLTLSPEHAEALNYLGYTYAEMGIHLEEAQDLIRKALSLKPQDGYITDSLGWVYYKKGDLANALKYLLKASELIPSDPTILEHLGDVYIKMGRPGDALKYYRQSMEKNPRNKNALREKIERITP